MPTLIAENQTSFVHGKHIMDNVIIAQEVIHSMRICKGKKGWMAIKVDMEKAYDRLRWEFIRDTLKEADLPDNLTRLIMQCVSTSVMKILWNGGLTKEEFTPSRGIC